MKKGFTLVELMVVMVIISVLAMAAMPSQYRRLENAFKRATEKNTETMNLVIKDYMMVKGYHQITFGDVDDYNKWNEVEMLIRGGFEEMEVPGYTLNIEAFEDCYMSIVYFNGILSEEAYTRNNQ